MTFDIIIFLCAAVAIVVIFYRTFTKKLAEVSGISKNTDDLAKKTIERYNKKMDSINGIIEILKRIEKKLDA